MNECWGIERQKSPYLIFFHDIQIVDRGRDEQLYDMLTDSRIYLERKNKDYVF